MRNISSLYEEDVKKAANMKGSVSGLSSNNAINEGPEDIGSKGSTFSTDQSGLGKQVRSNITRKTSPKTFDDNDGGEISPEKTELKDRDLIEDVTQRLISIIGSLEDLTSFVNTETKINAEPIIDSASILKSFRSSLLKELDNL